jgi:hypothetical protein
MGELEEWRADISHNSTEAPIHQLLLTELDSMERKETRGMDKRHFPTRDMESTVRSKINVAPKTGHHSRITPLFRIQNWGGGKLTQIWARRPVTLTVFARCNTEIVGSNPTGSLDVCVRLFCVYVVLCVGSGLASGWSPVQRGLPTVY